MKRLRHRLLDVSAILILLVISLSLTVIGGCTTNATSPTPNTTQDKLNWLNETFLEDDAQRGSGININSCPILFDTTLTKTVSPYGSQFFMVNGTEQIGFSLPYMAVTSSMTLTIRVTKYQAPFGDFWMLDCGPDGTVFNHPLYVQPNPRVTSTSESVLFYFNPETGLWEVQQVANQPSPQIPIYHFSKYGISE